MKRVSRVLAWSDGRVANRLWMTVSSCWSLAFSLRLPSSGISPMMVSPASWCIRVRRQGRRSDGGMMSGRKLLMAVVRIMVPATCSRTDSGRAD